MMTNQAINKKSLSVTDEKIMHEYSFDIKIIAAIRVRATSETEARRMLAEKLDAADSNFGSWDNGDPILAEASLDGEADLFEIDGETVR